MTQTAEETLKKLQAEVSALAQQHEDLQPKFLKLKEHVASMIEEWKDKLTPQVVEKSRSPISVEPLKPRKKKHV